MSLTLSLDVVEISRNILNGGFNLVVAEKSAKSLRRRSRNSIELKGETRKWCVFPGGKFLGSLLGESERKREQSFGIKDVYRY